MTGYLFSILDDFIYLFLCLFVCLLVSFSVGLSVCLPCLFSCLAGWLFAFFVACFLFCFLFLFCILFVCLLMPVHGVWFPRVGHIGLPQRISFLVFLIFLLICFFFFVVVSHARLHHNQYFNLDDIHRHCILFYKQCILSAFSEPL